MKKLFLKAKQLVVDTIRFFTYDIWRINSHDSSVKRVGLYNLLKSFILAIRNISGAQLNIRAGALTYSTLLSIVPFLAVLFAIARGFGFQNIVQSELFRYFSGQEELLRRAMHFIDQSIEYARGGVFSGSVSCCCSTRSSGSSARSKATSTTSGRSATAGLT